MSYFLLFQRNNRLENRLIALKNNYLFFLYYMEIEGKIIAVLPKQEGTSARTGNHWASQEYVLETHDQFPRKCCFRIFGEERINAMNVQAGEELRVSFDIDAREYNGRYFNTINAWRVDRVDPAAAVATPPPADYAQPSVPGAFPPPPAQGNASAQNPMPFPPTQENSTDDLPF